MTPEYRDQLLPRIAAGDVQAFALWLSSAEPRIRLSLSRFASSVDAEAVLQETLLRLWQVAHRVEVDPQGDALLRLGVRIARNLAIDHVRKLERTELVKQLTEQAAPDADSASPAEPDPLLRAVIQRCLEALPAKPRMALSARLENHGQEPDESLAERLQMKLNTFLKNFGRARQFLLECLRGQGVDLSFQSEAEG
ncbi:MAG: RNA polymerase sigma factor [Polyangiaceae bacterium]